MDAVGVDQPVISVGLGSTNRARGARAVVVVAVVEGPEPLDQLIPARPDEDISSTCLGGQGLAEGNCIDITDRKTTCIPPLRPHGTVPGLMTSHLPPIGVKKRDERCLLRKLTPWPML